MSKYLMVCQNCGDMFSTTTLRRFCFKCQEAHTKPRINYDEIVRAVLSGAKSKDLNKNFGVSQNHAGAIVNATLTTVRILKENAQTGARKGS